MRAESHSQRIKRAGLASFWLRKTLSEFQNLITADSRILDIGSGDSPYRDLWKPEHYLAIDLCHPEADIHGDILALPVLSGSMDLAVCTEVLEHVYETDAALSELHRILKSNGRLLLSAPLVMGRHETRDYHRFTRDSLQRRITSAGFDIIAMKPRGGIFSTMGVILTHIPEQLGARDVLSSLRPGAGSWFPRLFEEIRFLGALLAQRALRFLAVLDRLDVRKDFTLGYVVLAVKRK
jgi:SAM-dependent methyltransferase